MRPLQTVAMAPVNRKLALAAVVVLLCLETNKINKRKKKKKKVWSRSWLGKRGQFGMPALKTEIEVSRVINGSSRTGLGLALAG